MHKLCNVTCFFFQMTKIFSRICCLHSRVFFIPETPKDTNIYEEESRNSLLSHEKALINGRVSPSVYDSDPHVPNDPNRIKLDAHTSTFSNISTEMQHIKHSMNLMMSTIAANVVREQKLRLIQREWASVALVLDRMFFFIYAIAIASSLYLTFPRPPPGYMF